MQFPFKAITFVFALVLTANLTAGEALFTREGTDPAFATLIENGTLKPGERFAKITVLGSRIEVNHALLLAWKNASPSPRT